MDVKVKNGILGSFVLAAVVVAAFAGFSYFQKDSDALATVGGENITKTDLNELLYATNNYQGSLESPEASDEKKKALLDQLVEWKIAEIYAKDAGLKVSDKEIRGQARIQFSAWGEEYEDYYDSLSESDKAIADKVFTSQILVNKIKDKVVGYREGQFVLARFDRTYEREQDVTTSENQAKIKSDKEYAENLINSIKKDLDSGSLTFEAAMDKANNDTTIGLPAWGNTTTYTFSRAFTKNDSVTKGILSSSPNFWDEVFKIKEKGISEKVLLKVKDSSGTHDAMYAIFEITDLKEGSASYEDWLDQKKTDYKVKINS